MCLFSDHCRLLLPMDLMILQLEHYYYNYCRYYYCYYCCCLTQPLEQSRMWLERKAQTLTLAPMAGQVMMIETEKEWVTEP